MAPYTMLAVFFANLGSFGQYGPVFANLSSWPRQDGTIRERTLLLAGIKDGGSTIFDGVVSKQLGCGLFLS